MMTIWNTRRVFKILGCLEEKILSYLKRSIKMNSKDTIVFEPFIKFVIEFHNSAEVIGTLVRGKLQDRNLLSEEEIGLIEEAFLIKHIAEWEIFIQNIFAYCVAIDTTALSGHLELTLPKKISFDTAYAIINGLNFFNITSTDELIGMSKKILTDTTNPFKQFDKKFLNAVDEAYILRNYIAHKSKKSQKRLEKMYKERHNIESFIPPGKFLRQEFTDYIGTRIRTDLYYGTFMTIATKIWQFLDPKSYQFVFEDESSIESFSRGVLKMKFVFAQITKDNKL
jgi:hypothetical protein